MDKKPRPAPAVDLSNTGYVASKASKVVPNLSISIDGLRNTDYAEPKKDGIKMRGTGAATKGVTSRGPMG